MSADQKNTETLIKLGLTKLQAEIYLALTKLGTGSVKRIADFTKIDRAHVYQIIIKLQELGLVEKILSKPCLFKAISLKEGMQVLLKRKNQEIRNIEKVVSKIREEEVDDSLYPDLENQFILIPGRETHAREFGKVLSESKISFDNVFPNQRDFFRLIIAVKDNPFTGIFCKGNVKVRTLLCNPENEAIPKGAFEIIERLNKRGNFIFRYTKYRSPAMFAVVDNKTLVMHVGVASLWKDKPGLYSNNPCLVGMAKGYFDQLWQNSENER